MLLLLLNTNGNKCIKMMKILFIPESESRDDSDVWIHEQKTNNIEIRMTCSVKTW